MFPGLASRAVSLIPIAGGEDVTPNQPSLPYGAPKFRLLLPAPLVLLQ